MRPLLVKLLKKNRKSLIAYTVIAFLFAWMFASLFESIQSEAAQFEDLLSAYPESFVKAFNVESNIFTNFDSYVAAEYFSLMWPIMAIIFAVNLGASAIAQEVEQGTIELLLSAPISRAKLFLAKYLNGSIVLAVFTILSILAVGITAKFYDINVDITKYSYMTLISILFVQAVFSMNFLLSVLSSTKGKVLTLSAALIVLMYTFNIVSSLSEDAEFLKYFSIFYYYDYVGVLRGDGIDIVKSLVLIAITPITTAAGYFVFQREDID